MKTARITAESRARLDERLAQFGAAERYRPPSRGWIKAIREALGMSTAQLASGWASDNPASSVSKLQKRRGASSWRHCDAPPRPSTARSLYALIPNKPLGTTVRERARAFLRRRRQPVEHTMLLEDQQVTDSSTDAQS